MVTETDRSIYSLDLDTVQQFERLAAFRKTPKAGALRRAIQVAVQQAHSRRHAKLKALGQLQKRLALDEATRHSFPVGDIETMLREVEANRLPK